ncbi:MAG TPA: cytochrome C oxidase subunit IV family protein [Blastocatellia bacterium]|nr:cytochrome C oxidase subunit IV family protein [Blastocatellia bacterium]
MSEHVVSKKTYFLIFGALMVLTTLTVFIANFDLGPLNVIVALSIAVLKATLVVLYFMHVRYSSKLTWVFVGAGFFWLAILIAFTFSDFATRSWVVIAK